MIEQGGSTVAKKKKTKKSTTKKATKKKTTRPPAPAGDSGVKTDPEKIQVANYPEAGKKIDEFENSLDKQLAGADTQPAPGEKRGRGRPRKNPEPEPVAADAPIEMIEGFIKMPFVLWASKTGVKKLELTDDEAKQIAEPTKQLLDYYLPRMPDVCFAWASLAVSGFWITKPRLELLAELRRNNTLSSSSKGQGNPQGARTPADPGRLHFPSEIETQQL